MNFAIKPAYEYKEEVRVLFGEYTDMLLAGEPAFKEYLDIQNYEDELEHLEKKYGMPHGRLYLLYVNDCGSCVVAFDSLD